MRHVAARCGTLWHVAARCPLQPQAEEYGITREMSDGYAISSQQKWAAAHAAGKFVDELAPISLKGRKGDELFDTDEHPKPQVINI